VYSGEWKQGQYHGKFVEKMGGQICNYVADPFEQGMDNVLGAMAESMLDCGTWDKLMDKARRLTLMVRFVTMANGRLTLQ
jgi:hypothetical protein